MPATKKPPRNATPLNTENRPPPPFATREDETCGAQRKERCRRKQIVQCPGRGRLDRHRRRARRISADRIGDEGSRPDQADSPDTNQDPPDFMTDTGQAHQAESKRQRKQADNQ
jgi:hypothetical protein